MSDHFSEEDKALIDAMVKQVTDRYERATNQRACLLGLICGILSPDSEQETIHDVRMSICQALSKMLDDPNVIVHDQIELETMQFAANYLSGQSMIEELIMGNN